MNSDACHAGGQGALEIARRHLLKDLGAKRVAAWCQVSVDAVYQWLSRGTDDQPIPPAYVTKIVAGARSEGIACDAALLWPAGALALTATPEALRLARAH